MRRVGRWWREPLMREVGALCLVIICADLVMGVLAPTFSLHAQQLGLSVALLGTVNAVGGIMQLCSSLPLGVFSDRLGRPGVITAGMVAFGLALLAFAFAQDASLLFVGRLLTGIAGVATFQLGAAHLGDITTPRQRSVAFGLYTTSMGIGFTIGPLLGGQIAERTTIPTSYVVGAVIAFAGGLLAIRTLRRPVAAVAERVELPVPADRWRGFRTLPKAQLALVSIGSLLTSWTFAGALSTFFPLYGKALGLSTATIGGVFALRSLVSATGRLPIGLLARVVGTRPILISALAIEATIMFIIAATTTPWILTLLLALEGLSFGAYLVAGQTFLADHTTKENRGTAVGLYATASSIGGTAAPAILGRVADAWGLPLTFTCTAWALAAGAVALGVGTLWLARRGERGEARAASVGVR